MSIVLQSPPFPVKGWAPIERMIDLWAEIFDAPVETADAPRLPPLTLRMAGRRKAARGGETGLVFIARGPRDIPAALAAPRFRKTCAFRAIWIIDSFWTEQLPAARALSDFDAVAFTQGYDTDTYRALAGDRALCLPWGSDVLEYGSNSADRDIDILRVGRQPAIWDDDARTREMAAARGLSFVGRPPVVGTRSARQHDLMTRWYARAKFVLASSNRIDATRYTHPHKEYITARWTDALACGACVAGDAPHSDTGGIDWPGAVLDLGGDDLEGHLDRIARAVADWTPDIARQNHREALMRLDWRWRFDAMAHHLGIDPPERLTRELDAVRVAAGAAKGGPA